MTDLPTQSSDETGRVRVQGAASPRIDVLPVLYLIGFLILAAALAYLWRHPAGTEQQGQRVESLSERLEEARRRSDALAARLDALEARPMPAPVSLAPIESRLAALERRPVPAPPSLAPLESRLAALEARPAVDVAPLSQRIDALQARLGTDEAELRRIAAGLDAIAGRAARLGRIQAAAAALTAGQPVGEIPDAPPALARFAHEAPPTESGLRLGFEQAAAAASRASRPATEGLSFLGRMWARAQSMLTVREGDRVIVGDPAAGVIQHARGQLDAGDLAGAVRTLQDGLSGPARAAMAAWLDQAQALLAARAAIATLARG